MMLMSTCLSKIAKKKGFEGVASKNTNSVIADIEKSYNEREFRSRRFRPTFEGWVGDYGPPTLMVVKVQQSSWKAMIITSTVTW